SAFARSGTGEARSGVQGIRLTKQDREPVAPFERALWQERSIPRCNQSQRNVARVFEQQPLLSRFQGTGRGLSLSVGLMPKRTSRRVFLEIRQNEHRGILKAELARPSAYFCRADGKPDPIWRCEDSDCRRSFPFLEFRRVSQNGRVRPSSDFFR